jgi:hypothetical protein
VPELLIGAHPAAVAHQRLGYILAPSHSGSTLLAMLLNSHPEVCTVGELKFTALGDFAQYRCSCRSLIRECPFWTGVAKSISARGLSFDVSRPGTHYAADVSALVSRLLRPLLEAIRDAALWCSPQWHWHLPQVQRMNAALIGSVLDNSGKHVLVDSSKIGLRLKYLRRNTALDVRAIRLIRDGRAVALTYMDPSAYADARDPGLRGGGSGAARDAEHLAIEQAAWEWRRSTEEASLVVASMPASAVHEVRYEQLCLDTEATLQGIFHFLGVDAQAARRDFRAAAHHVVGNGMRLDTVSNIVLDERWRSVLSAEQLRLFNGIAGSLNRRLGYQ